MSKLETKDEFKARKAAKLKKSKQQDKAWERLIRNLDYEQEPTDILERVNYLKPRKLGKNVVR